MQWTTIRTFSGLKFLGFSYSLVAFVPFLAHVIQVIHIVELPWTVFWIFIASVFVLIAITISGIKCPENLKNYKTREDFIKALLQLEENASPSKKADIVGTHCGDEKLKRELAELLAAQESGEASGVQKERLAQIMSMNYSSAVQRYLSDKWDRENSSSPGLRTAASICLGIAAAIALGVWGYRIYLVLSARLGSEVAG